MRITYEHAPLGLFALSVGVGCGSGVPASMASDPVPPVQVEQSIEQSFERLRALRIVDVRNLVLNLPAEATACYGLPCEGSVWEQRYRDERARQAPRLARLTDLAEATVHGQYHVTHDKSEAEAAIQALAALAIVEVAGLVETKPANNPQCYNLPCPTEVDAADRENSARVSQVFAIVDAAKQSNL